MRINVSGFRAAAIIPIACSLFPVPFIILKLYDNNTGGEEIAIEQKADFLYYI